MTTIIEAKEKLDSYKNMLKSVNDDIYFTHKIIEGLEDHESQIRKKYHIALTEYDNLTINRRRHFR